MQGKVALYLKNPLFLGAVAMTVLMLALMFIPTTEAYAKDYFAKAKGDVKATFGAGSAVVYVIYFVEVLAALWMFIKSKSPAVFIGIVAVMLFVNVATGLF
ncbi:hypothetical protein SME46J_49920 (plasmid) [Serratia marcescens]|nr:hypothetical protein SME46J_49920 [Serratia marcescens]